MAETPDKPERSRKPRRQPGSEDAMTSEGDELVEEQAAESAEQPETERPSPLSAHEVKRAPAEDTGTHKKAKAAHESKTKEPTQPESKLPTDVELMHFRRKRKTHPR